MPTGKYEGLAGRLSEAYKNRYKSVLQFQKAIEAHAKKLNKETKGDDYPSVTAYVKGERQPRPEWLEVAAEVTGYRAEWLAFGSGERTSEDQATADASRSMTPIERIGPAGVNISDADAEWFRTEFEKEGSLYYKLTPTVQLMFNNVYARLVKYALPKGRARRRDERLAMATKLVEAVKGGVVVQPPEDIRSPQFTDYAWSMLHTIALSLRAKIDAIDQAMIVPKRR